VIRKIVREALETAHDDVPGNAPPKKQVHVFDFDDTLGVTQNANGIMLMKDGEPAHKTAEDADAWADSLGLSDALLPGPGGKPIEQPEGIDGFAVYISSGALSKARNKYPNRASMPKKPKSEGEGLWIDYTPSSNTQAADPIGPTIAKLRAATSQGAQTMVMTARSGESGGQSGTDFGGHKVDPTNEKDIASFLGDQGGVSPSKGVVGLSGCNKGDAIKRQFFSGKKDSEKPDEVHFYDDDPVNTDAVKSALEDDPEVDAEVYIYGPGHFDRGEADPHAPTTVIPSKEGPEKETQAENIDLNRWSRLAGLTRD
jgi:hypothetical protein